MLLIQAGFQFHITVTLETNPGLCFPSQSNHIIGDSASRLHTYLMVPLRDTDYLTANQINFNKRLSRTRVCIENACSYRTGRFRRVKHVHADFPRIEKNNSTLLCAAQQYVLQRKSN